MSEEPVGDQQATSPVESIDRALRTLQLLMNAGSEGLALAEISAELGANKSTLHRVLGALKFRSFVSQDLASGRYSLGPEAVALSQSFLSGSSLATLLHPALVGLSHAVDELVHLGSMSGPRVMYLDKVEPDRPIRVWSRVGREMPAVTTALGRALLAAQGADNAMLRSYYDAVERQVPIAFEQVVDAVERAKRMGFSREHEENEPGISCMAVCLVHTGRPVAAVSITAPAERMTDDRVDQLYTHIKQSLSGSLPPGFELAAE